MPAHHVDPIMRGDDALEALDLSRRMAHDLEQLFVRPHIGRQRRDVQIADEDHAIGSLAAYPAEPGVHGFKKIELVTKFRIERRIGQITTRRHINVMQGERLYLRATTIELDREMPRMTAPANVAS